MFKVIFKDLNDVVLGSGTFQTELEAQNWRDSQLSKVTYLGKKAQRWVKEGVEIFNVEDAIDTRLVEDGLNGDYTEYLLPAEYTYEIQDLSQDVEYVRKQDMESKIAKGKAIKKLSDDILFLITGWNDAQSLTAEEINTLQTTFATIDAYLRAGRPFSAKPLIEAIEPSALVPQELLDQVGLLYLESGLV